MRLVQETKVDCTPEEIEPSEQEMGPHLSDTRRKADDLWGEPRWVPARRAPPNQLRHT